MTKGEFTSTINGKELKNIFNPKLALFADDSGSCETTNINSFAKIPINIESVLKQLNKNNYFRFGNVSIKNNCIDEAWYRSKETERKPVERLAKMFQNASKKLIKCLIDIGTPQRIKDAMALQSLITKRKSGKRAIVLECLEPGQMLASARYKNLSPQKRSSEDGQTLDSALGLASRKGTYSWPSLALNKERMDNVSEATIGHEIMHLLGYIHRGYPDETYALEMHCFADEKKLSTSDKKRMKRYVKTLGTPKERSINSITDWFVVYNKHSTSGRLATRPLSSLISGASDLDLIIGFHKALSESLKDADKKQRERIEESNILYSGILHRFTEKILSPEVSKVLRPDQKRAMEKVHKETGATVKKELTGGGLFSGNIESKKHLSDDLADLWFEVTYGTAFSKRNTSKKAKTILSNLFSNNFGCKQYPVYQQAEIRNLINTMRNTRVFREAMMETKNGTSRTNFKMNESMMYFCR